MKSLLSNFFTLSVEGFDYTLLWLGVAFYFHVGCSFSFLSFHFSRAATFIIDARFLCAWRRKTQFSWKTQHNFRWFLDGFYGVCKKIFPFVRRRVFINYWRDHLVLYICRENSEIYRILSKWSQKIKYFNYWYF